MNIYTKDFLRCLGVTLIPSILALINQQGTVREWSILITGSILLSLIYPFSMRFVRGICPTASESNYWYIFTFAMTVIFAVPLAILYFIRLAFKKGA